MGIKWMESGWGEEMFRKNVMLRIDKSWTFIFKEYWHLLEQFPWHHFPSTPYHSSYLFASCRTSFSLHIPLIFFVVVRRSFWFWLSLNSKPIKHAHWNIMQKHMLLTCIGRKWSKTWFAPHITDIFFHSVALGCLPINSRKHIHFVWVKNRWKYLRHARHHKLTIKHWIINHAEEILPRFNKFEGTKSFFYTLLPACHWWGPFWDPFLNPAFAWYHPWQHRLSPNLPKCISFKWERRKTKDK